jgi:hypothetical protein
LGACSATTLWWPAATGGISYVVSQISCQTIKSTSTSLSLSDNLEKSIVLYDTYGLVKAKVHADLAGHLDGVEPRLGQDQARGQPVAHGRAFRGPAAQHRLRAHRDQLEQLPDRAPLLAIAVTGQANLVFLLKEMPRGVFPDLKFNMGTASALISSATKANAGVERGFYLHVQGNDLEAAIVTAIIKRSSRSWTRSSTPSLERMAPLRISKRRVAGQQRLDQARAGHQRSAGRHLPAGPARVHRRELAASHHALGRRSRSRRTRSTSAPTISSGASSLSAPTCTTGPRPSTSVSSILASPSATASSTWGR